MHPRNTFLSFLGIGSHTAAPLLYTYVAENPGACLASKPTHFFSKTEVFAKGTTWYEAQFPKAKAGALRGELAHNYLSNAATAGLIARTYPDAKLLAVIENPLVSVRVEYIEAIRSRQISRQTALAQFLKMRPEVLLRACYGRQLVPYFSYYSALDLLVWLASDIREDPLKAVRVTYEHLGLPADFVPLKLRHLVVAEDDEVRRGLLKRSGRFVRELIRSGYGYLVKITNQKPPPTETASELARKLSLEPELEEYLKDYYREDVRQLSDLLHRDLLVEWGFAEVSAVGDPRQEKTRR